MSLLKEVSQFEANLIRILRCLLGDSPIEQSLAVILRGWSRPRCLSRACVDLVQDSLAKGVPLFLARQGWNTERFLRDESVVSGRLWQRSRPEHLQLDYSRNALKWLIWLTAENPATPIALPNIAFEDCTSGDAVLFLLSFARLRETPAVSKLVLMPVFAENPLVRLVFPDAFASQEFGGAPELESWFQAERSWLLEALQPWLRLRWLQIERLKQQITSWEELQSVGEAQQTILTAYLDAADNVGRRDLTRFVMDVAARLLRSSAGRDQKWFEQVVVDDLRIADRQNVYETGLVLLRSVDRFQKWNQSARGVGFYEEEYAASQLWKSDWEKWNGDSVCRQARDVVKSLAEFRVS